MVKDIMRVKEEMGYNHFPTRSEIISFYGNESLTNRISRTGGTRYWANKLNLPIKSCESELGNKYELYAIEQIKDKTKLDARQTRPRYPYDIIVDSNIKVDVKVSKPFKNSKGVISNTFNLEKTEPTCDIFILYCLKENGEIYKTLIVPSCITQGKTQLGVGFVSKWDIFADKWDYFGEYSKFNKAILKEIIIPSRRRRTAKNDLAWEG
jgi:hypothetical protein